MIKRTFWCHCLFLITISSANSSLADECNALSMTSMKAPPGTVGVSYKHKVQTYGGEAPVSLLLKEGILPAGLTFSSTGEITGTPRESGSFTVTISAIDSCKPQTQITSQALQLTFSGPGNASPADPASQLRKASLKVTVSTSPAAFSIPSSGAVERQVSYQLTSQPPETATLTSLGGTFAVAGAVVESVATPLTATFINGKSALSETIVIPTRVLDKARREKDAKIVYSRAFSGRGTTALGVVEFTMVFEQK
jgi:hypothetical protein